MRTSKVKTKAVNKKDSETENETTPKRKNKILAIILRKNKSALWKWVNFKKAQFRIEKNTYFNVPSGIYLSKNKVLMSIYIEGISMPIDHNLITHEDIEVTITDPKTNEEKTSTITKINDLKFDSEIMDILLNRGLANEFTKAPVSIGSVITLILLFITMISSFACLGVLLS